MQENIFGVVKPIEDLISFSYSRSAKTISPTEIQNLFHPIVNYDTKLFKCKKHIKLESERKWEFAKGYLLFFFFSLFLFFFFLFFIPDSFFFINQNDNKIIKLKTNFCRRQLSCALANVRWIGYLVNTLMARELQKHSSSSEK